MNMEFCVKDDYIKIYDEQEKLVLTNEEKISEHGDGDSKWVICMEGFNN